MELNTGRLMKLSGTDEVPDGCEIVPPDYEKLAAMKMRFAQAFGQEPVVNMRGNSPLAKWGRDKLKEKRKAKIAAASRRKNRK